MIPLPTHSFAAIPRFALYGEQPHADHGGTVHIEHIETRSRSRDWHIGTHTHAGLFQILFLFGGEVRAEIDGARWEHCGPVAITIHPSVAHGFDFSPEAQGYVLTVGQHLVFSAAENQAGLYASLFVAPLAIALAGRQEAQGRIEALLQQSIAEAACPQQGHALMLEWLARSALLLLLRVHAESQLADLAGRSDFELFSRFRTEVERRFTEQWQVGQYADLLRVTPARLSRLCLRVSGKSAFDVIQERLMLEACRKLTYFPGTIASVAYQLGFEDPAYFSRLFKKRNGLTPKEFRAMQH
jgi:AraC family transcriptional activator of pobA